MNNFPSYLTPEKKTDFSKYLDQFHLDLMRQEFFQIILKGNESDSFDLVNFNRKYTKNMEKTKEFTDKIIEELHSLNWKTKYAYGDTSLFIYSTEDPPVNAW